MLTKSAHQLKLRVHQIQDFLYHKESPRFSVITSSKLQPQMMSCLEDSEKVVNYCTSIHTNSLPCVSQLDKLLAVACDLDPLGQVLVMQYKSKFGIRVF